MTKSKAKKVLVLGAYGLIGAEVFKHLKSTGHDPIPLGRNLESANRVLPNELWIIRDIAFLTRPKQWEALLESFDFVVNCAGALQTSRFDDLENLQHHAVAALAKACVSMDVGLIQISAVGAKLDADTEFLSSKARGDECIRKLMKRFWIFRPGLVLCHTAYGGTQLIRMIAAFPFIQPIAHADSKIQTIAVDDLACAILKAVGGKLDEGLECDLVERDIHSLKDIILAHRTWLGFQNTKAIINIPNWLIGIVSSFADGLGHLGWRSPLRKTATIVLKSGVLGEHSPAILTHTKSLKETLYSFPSTVEDRLFARMALLLPVIVGILSLFWILSGIIGIFSIETATEVLTNTGWPYALAFISVLFWALVDIILGSTIMVRQYARLVTVAMVVVSVLYLLFSTLFVPALWIDPLGPLVKILPSMVLALVARVLLENR